MFTGLIEEIGTLRKIQSIAGGRRLFVNAKTILNESKVGDSIAVNGVCLTVVQKEPYGFWVEAVGDTLQKTTAKNWQVGEKLNLERALRLSDRLGGHLLQGHVNSAGRVRQLKPLGKNYFLQIEVPHKLLRYFIEEGSIAIDGISLTIARLERALVGISIIPHTFKNTNLSYRHPGDAVNIEVDVIAKYVERLLMFSNEKSDNEPLGETWLKKMGF